MLKLAQVPPVRNQKNSSRGLALYGTVYAPSGFRPRAKATPKPFRAPPNDPLHQTTLGAKKLKRATSPQRSASPPPPSPAAAPPPSSPTTLPSASRKKRLKTNPQCPKRAMKSHQPSKCAFCGGKPLSGTVSMARHREKIGKAAVNAKAAAYRAADPDRAARYMRARRAADPVRYCAVYKTAEYRAYHRRYMRDARAADPDRYFHDTYQSSLIGRLRGTRPSALVDGLRKACTVPPAAVDDIFDHLKAQSPPRAKKWMNVSTWGKGQGKCELDHMFPKKLESGIKGVMGYQHTLEDIFREYNDDNMQAILGTDNRIKSNKLPSVPELDACRNTWPVHWGDVLPKAIPCPRGYEHLLTARPLAQQTFYSKLPRDPYYDADWIKSLCDLFGIEA